MKYLTRKDFANAFNNSEIKDKQTGMTLRSGLMTWEGMDIAAEVAFRLYAENLGIPVDGSICLSDRQEEFQAALAREFEQDFKIISTEDKNTFFVVNHTEKREQIFMMNQTIQPRYRVELKTIDGKLWAKCVCKDFVYRERLCKHIGQILLERQFGKIGMQEKAEVLTV